MLVFVPVLRFHCRWGVGLLAVVVVVAIALAIPRLVRDHVVGWLCLGVGPTVVASRCAIAS